MRFLVILLLFVFAVVGSAFYAKVGMRESVEAELAAKASAALGDAGFTGVKVEFDHLDGKLSGTVDRPEDIRAVVALVREKVAAAHWPEAEATGVKVRPTLPPRIRVHRAEGSQSVGVEGVLSVLDEPGKTLIGSRLHALPGVGEIENALSFDQMVVPFPQMAEMVSLASGLLAHGGAVEVDYADGRLRVIGEVPNDGLKSGLLDLVGKIGAGEVVDEIRVKPLENYTHFAELKLTRNRFGITLSGTYPSASDRDGLLGALRKIEGIPAITDRIEVSELCGPTEWLEPLKSILPALLSGLRGEMTAEFTGSQIRLSGVAPDEATKHDLLNRFTRFQVGSPLYEFVGDIGLEGGGAAAELELTAVYEGGLLMLSGQVPSADFAAGVAKRLAQPLPDVSVKDGVTVVEGSTQDRWVSRLADFFAEALPRVSSAKFVFKGRELELEGRTLALSDRQLVQNLAVNTVPSNYRVHNRLLHADQPFPKPALQPEVRTRLAEALKSHPVYFGKNSDEIGADERKKVAAVAEALKAAGTEAELVVTGVSDNIGNAQSNRELSLRRAEGVRAELVRLGIAEGTLSVESKSEDVSDIARSERWKSRRVEISLKPVGNAPAEP